ncbi:MAG: CvpA family protein [Chitinispirillales bacterium]|jgi:uncharacterized membrane protein required for colicin V production|nr:CvpA family protein [Chitinispirillales bacterium]
MGLALDLGVLVVAALLGLMGASSGIIKEAFRFAGLVGGFLVAFLFYRDLQAIIEKTLPVTPTHVAAVMAFIAIALAVLLAAIGIGSFLRKSTELLSFGWVDKAFGAALGAGKAAIIAWAACLSISSLPMEETTTTETSQSEQGRTIVHKTTARGPTQQQFSDSVVYGIFNQLPGFMRLDGLEDAKNIIRRPEQPATVPAEMQNIFNGASNSPD